MILSKKIKPRSVFNLNVTKRSLDKALFKDLPLVLKKGEVCNG